MNDLFSEENLNLEFIGNNYYLKKTSNEDVVHLYKNDNFIKIQNLKPQIEKRIFVVDMVEGYGVTKSLLAKSLNTSRQSIDNWLKTHNKYGSEGLVNNTKDSWKKNPKRFKGNKSRELEKERLEAKQNIDTKELRLNFEKGSNIDEKNEVYAQELYTEEFDYQENRYSGSLLYLAILVSRFNYLNQLSSIVKKHLWIPFMFVMMHVNKIASVEQFKLSYKREFGQILGIKKLAYLSKIRENIWGLVELQEAETGMKSFFKHQIIKGIVSIWRIFLDGHLVPYSGKEKIHKAHSTQRDLMMPGQTEFFGHDSNGNIVYFDIQEGKGDMMASFRHLSSLIKQYNEEIPPLVVVDRELWGVEKFLSIKELRFVTWEKNCDKKLLSKLATTNFTGSLSVNGKDYICFEEKKTYYSVDKKSIELRRIICRNTKSNENFAIVSNDSLETTEVIAESMLNRWGASENGFKHLGTRTAMHYNPTWKVAAESTKQDIVNPQYITLKRNLKKKKIALSKVQKELGKKNITINKDGTLRKSLVRDKNIEKREFLEKEIVQINKEVANCPERIDLRKISKKTFKKIDTQGKKWWNLSEMIFWNSRKILSRMLFTYLPDNRDLLPVLDSITKSKGWIKSTSNMFIVKLEPLENRRFRDAQIQLCRHLNTQKIKLPNGKLLQYDVSKNPFSVQ